MMYHHLLRREQGLWKKMPLVHFKSYTSLSLVLIIIVAVFFVTTTATARTAAEEAATTWKVIWFEQFHNLSQWNIEEGGDYGSKEAQYYTSDDNSTVSLIHLPSDDQDNNSILQLRAIKQTRTIIDIVDDQQQQQQKQWYSGRVNSSDHFSFKYGKIEARMRMDNYDGVFGSLWMYPQNEEYGQWPNSGEIDIVSYQSIWKTSSLWSTLGALHTSTHNDRNCLNYKSEDNDPSEWSLYTVIWEPDYIEFWLNERILWRYSKPVHSNWRDWPFDQEFYFVINLAMNPEWGSKASPDLTSASMEIDWIRVSQRVERYHNTRSNDTTSQQDVVPSVDTCDRVNCGAHYCCDGTCYDHRQFTCSHGKLCVFGFESCGDECYHPALFNCTNGELIPRNPNSNSKVAIPDETAPVAAAAPGRWMSHAEDTPLRSHEQEESATGKEEDKDKSSIASSPSNYALRLIFIISLVGMALCCI